MVKKTEHKIRARFDLPVDRSASCLYLSVSFLCLFASVRFCM